MVRSIWQMARSVLIESLRRKEIYVVVLVALAVIGGVTGTGFFHLPGLSKFYREVALKIMGGTTALAVVVLAARQLPREFEARTIYPLLARPISRSAFLAGKLLGVVLSAFFCLSLLMTAFVTATLWLGGTIPWALFLQYVYLQMLAMLILATLSFWLSMVLNLDAAITVGVLVFLLASTLTAMISSLYEVTTAAGRTLLLVLNYAVPQLALLDLSEKAVHAEMWPPLSLHTMAMLTLYALIFAACYFSFTMLCFRRRAL